jgi:hypothetical protein
MRNPACHRTFASNTSAAGEGRKRLRIPPDRCRAAPWRLAYKQVLTKGEPHPPAELVTITGRLRVTRSRRPCLRRALSIGRQRSSTDNHGRCPCLPSCRISPDRAVRGCFPSSRWTPRRHSALVAIAQPRHPLRLPWPRRDRSVAVTVLTAGTAPAPPPAAPARR